MLLAAIRGSAFLVAALIASSLSAENWEWIYQTSIELVFIGRIPGTELYISFEWLFAGVIFGLWTIWAYQAYSKSLNKIHEIMTLEESRIKNLEEIAL